MKKLLVSCCFLISLGAQAVTLKLGVLAPEGTNWAENLKKMTKEVKKKTEGEVDLRIYFGGSQGDEPAVLRKIRIGQLQGGIFTGKTLGELNGDIRVMELPFTFGDDREKGLETLRDMEPFFNEGLRESGFVNLGFYEIGMVYFISQKETPNLESLKGIKIWTWEGDDLVSTMIDTMGLVSVPLALPDVLSSLSTGVIQAAYAPPLGILSLQWHTKVRYLVDLPLSYSVGAMLVAEKAWKKISEENQKKIREIADKYVKQVNEGNIKDNKQALKAMKSSLNFLEFSEEDQKLGLKYREKVIEKLKGDLFSPEALKKLNKHLEEN